MAYLAVNEINHIMKKMIFAAFAELLAVGCGNYTKDGKEAITGAIPQEMEYTLTREDTINAMALAFAQQESQFNHTAVSPCGRWVGCLQLSEIMVREANRIVGVDCFNYDDRYDRQGSYAIFKIVQQHHNPNLEIDRAIDVWNPGCGSNYQGSVKKYFKYNLMNYNKLKNYYEI